MNDGDRIIKEFSRRIKSMEYTPEDNLWKNIETELDKKRFPWVKTVSILGAAVLATGIAILMFTPAKTTSGIDNNLTVKTQLQTQQDNNIQPVYDTDSSLQSIKKIVYDSVEVFDYIIMDSVIADKHNDKNDEPVSFIDNVQPQSTKSVQPAEISIIKNKEAEHSDYNQKEFSQIAENKFLEDKIFGDSLIFPNAFEPLSHEDKINTFRPMYKQVDNYELMIFSRNGTKVFTSKDVTFGWDGKIKGVTADKGVYIWIAKYNDSDGRPHQQKGTLWLHK